jgi:hypothetical protein
MAKKRAVKKEPVRKRTPKAQPAQPREKTMAELRAEGLSGKALKAALDAQKNPRLKPPQIKKGEDTRPMVQRRYEAEKKAEAAGPKGQETYLEAMKPPKTGYSRWQLSVQANPSRAKKPWKTKTDKASGKKGSTKALDKSKDSGVTRGSNQAALKAAGRKTKGKKAKGAKIKSSKKAKR